MSGRRRVNNNNDEGSHVNILELVAQMREQNESLQAQMREQSAALTAALIALGRGQAPVPAKNDQQQAALDRVRLPVATATANGGIP